MYASDVYVYTPVVLHYVPLLNSEALVLPFKLSTIGNFTPSYSVHIDSSLSSIRNIVSLRMDIC